MRTPPLRHLDTYSREALDRLVESLRVRTSSVRDFLRNRREERARIQDAGGDLSPAAWCPP